MTVLPATLNLKVAPLQAFHFDGDTHQADEHGLIRGVPYDIAMLLIRDEKHPAREATAEEIAEADAADTEFPPSVGIELAGPATEDEPATDDTPAGHETAAADAAPHDGEALPETAGE